MLDTQSDSGLLILTLNRGDEGNPLNLAVLKHLRQAIEDGTNAPEIRAILLRSNSDTFCIGMDLAALLSDKSDRGGDLRESIEAYSAVLTGIYASPKPVVCMLSGEVRAGGVGLACACDIVVATAETTLALTEVLFGLVPANVLPYLLGLRVSPQKARYLVLTAKTVEADEALRIGLIDEIEGRETMNRRLRTLVRQLMRSSPEALSEAKRLTRDMLWQDLDTSKESAIRALEHLANDPKVLEGIRAFREGQTPDWFSRFKPEADLFSSKES